MNRAYKLIEQCEGRVDTDAFYKEGQADAKAGKPKNPKHSQSTTGGFAYLSGYADESGTDFPPNKNKGKSFGEAKHSWFWLNSDNAAGGDKIPLGGKVLFLADQQTAKAGDIGIVSFIDDDMITVKVNNKEVGISFSAGKHGEIESVIKYGK